jgi:hypothetical protein
MESPINLFNPFFETWQDIESHKNNGTSRLEKDLETVLDKANAIQCPMNTMQIRSANYSSTALQLITENKNFLKSY